MDIFSALKTKLADFSRVSALSAREGIEKLEERSTEFVMLNKVKMERKAIERSIDDIYGKLGDAYYRSDRKKRSKTADKALQDLVDKIRLEKKNLETKSLEIQQLYSELSPEIVEREKLNSLHDLLSEGEATLEFIRIMPNCPLVNKKLKNAKLPNGVLVAVILRDVEMIVPNGTAILKAGDHITLIGKRKELAVANKLFEES